MASLTELEQWEEQIYQLETTDPVKGGDDGISNRQAKQLGNRTKYLKKLILDAIGSDTDFATTVTNLLSQKVSIQDLQKGKYIFATDTGVANAYVCNLTPAITERDEGQVIKFKVANANNGASTINDGVGIVPLVGGAHAALQGGELVAGGDAWAQWNSSVGTGSYVLLFCSAAPLQVADGSKSKHALTLGQLTGSIGASSGWKKQPFLDTSDGLVKQLMEQWGVATVSVTSAAGGTFVVTLPVAFTAAIHHISANLRSNAVLNDNVSAYAYPTSLGTITLVLDAPGAGSFPTGTYYIYWRVQGV